MDAASNSVAWKALEEERPLFPPGAMFGKISYSTKEDAFFPVSLEPSNLVRIQLMRKEATGFGKSGGWTYGVLLSSGNHLEDTPVDASLHKATSCQDCHSLASSRDYVFSRPPLQDSVMPFGSALTGKFHEVVRGGLDDLQRSILFQISKIKEGKIHVGEMKLFAGSLDEISVPLAKLAVKTGVPHFLMDRSQKLFILAEAASSQECPAGIRLITPNVNEADKQVAPKEFSAFLQSGFYCAGKVKWETTLVKWQAPILN